MLFNNHYNLEGLHAFLGASKHHWVNYDEDKLAATYQRHAMAMMGSRLHEFAAEAIKLKIKQSKSKKTLNMFINDAIGYNMTPEQVLYYSPNSFGTADAISFRNNYLRIHDLKTGVTPANMNQLLIYAALFCLEYKIKPGEIDIELRIYQSDEIIYFNPTAEDILPIMDKIISFDKLIDNMKQQEV